MAEVSVPNPNVYYEIGLADALGKPVFLFKQENVTLPADFGGVHYYNYDLNDLTTGRQKLASELTQWAEEKDNRAFGVKAPYLFFDELLILRFMAFESFRDELGGSEPA